MDPKLRDLIWRIFFEAAKSGQFFSVTFKRRTDKRERNKVTGQMETIARAGDLRSMVCRTGVKKHLTGEGAAYSFRDKGLLPVWEVAAYKVGRETGLSEDEAGKKAYRAVPVDTITEISLV